MTSMYCEKLGFRKMPDNQRFAENQHLIDEQAIK